MLVKKRHQKRLEALEAHEVEMAKQEDDKEVSSTTAKSDSSTKDAILEFRLAEIVVDQALISIGECNSGMAMILDDRWKMAIFPLQNCCCNFGGVRMIAERSRCDWSNDCMIDYGIRAKRPSRVSPRRRGSRKSRSSPMG